MANGQDEPQVDGGAASTADGYIWIESSELPPVPNVQLGDLDTDEGSSHQIVFEEHWSNQTNGRLVWSRRLMDWTDPTTPPKTRTKCVKYATVGPIKTCVGWKTETKWLRKTATIIVSLKTAADIKKDIDNCVKTAAIIAAIAAIKSGGTAAIAALERTFFACLQAKLGANIVSVKLNINSRWTGWQ